MVISLTVITVYTTLPISILCISQSEVALYLGITVEFLNNWVFDHGIIQANRLQKPTTRLQIDLHCLAVHKNTNKRTLEY